MLHCNGSASQRRDHSWRLGGGGNGGGAALSGQRPSVRRTASRKTVHTAPLTALVYSEYQQCAYATFGKWRLSVTAIDKCVRHILNLKIHVHQHAYASDLTRRICILVSFAGDKPCFFRSVELFCELPSFNCCFLRAFGIFDIDLNVSKQGIDLGDLS